MAKPTTWLESLLIKLYGLSIMLLMVVKVKVLVCNYPILVMRPPMGMRRLEA